MASPGKKTVSFNVDNVQLEKLKKVKNWLEKRTKQEIGISVLMTSMIEIAYDSIKKRKVTHAKQ
jgi:hypothetical protein